MRAADAVHWIVMVLTSLFHIALLGEKVLVLRFWCCDFYCWGPDESLWFSRSACSFVCRLGGPHYLFPFTSRMLTSLNFFCWVTAASFESWSFFWRKQIVGIVLRVLLWEMLFFFFSLPILSPFWMLGNSHVPFAIASLCLFTASAHCFISWAKSPNFLILLL